MNIFNRIPFPFQFESVRYFSHSLNHPLFIYIYQLTCMVSNYHSDFLKIKYAGELVMYYRGNNLICDQRINLYISIITLQFCNMLNIKLQTDSSCDFMINC